MPGKESELDKKTFSQKESPEPPLKASSLPGYYEFFMKTGRLVKIDDEIERDKQIEVGDLKLVPVGRELPDISLSLASGETVNLRNYIGNKNLLITTFRSWW